MTDIADEASGLVEEHLARSLRAARVPIAVGVPGECDDCGEDSPRLVDGRCARCRDGRNRPAGWLRPSPAPAALPVDAPILPAVPRPAPPLTVLCNAPPPSPTKDVAMPAAPDPVAKPKSITLPRDAHAVARTIEKLAVKEGCSEGHAAWILIAAGERARTKGSDAPASIDQGAASLSALPLDAILDEVRMRCGANPVSGELASWQARAEAAEAKVAQLRAALG